MSKENPFKKIREAAALLEKHKGKDLELLAAAAKAVQMSGGLVIEDVSGFHDRPVLCLPRSIYLKVVK